MHNNLIYTDFTPTNSVTVFCGEETNKYKLVAALAVAWKFLNALLPLLRIPPSHGPTTKMPHPKIFQGQRGKWLDAQLEDYGKAIDFGTTAAFIRGVQRRFLARWPMSLPLNEEQSEEFIAQVDDNAPIEESDLSGFSEEQLNEMSAALKLRKAVSQPASCSGPLLTFNTCVQQIARYFPYYYSQKHSMSNKNGLSPAFVALLSKLSGVDAVRKPRQPAVWQAFQAHYSDLVKERVEEALAGLTDKQKDQQRAGKRSKVTTDMYHLCSQAEQRYWENEAKRIGDEQKANWMATIKSGPAQTPQERQA